MSNENIEKGRHLLKMRMKSCKHLGNQDSDLLKVPLEALHSLALQQIGEQESYIEELESKLKSLTEPVTLTRKDHVRIAEETRRQIVIADIWNRFIESQRKKYWVGCFSKASNRNTRAHVELIETLFIHYLFIQDVRIINKDKLKKKPSVPLTVINRWILKYDDCHKVNKSSRLSDLPDVILYDGEEYWGSEKLKYLVSE